MAARKVALSLNEDWRQKIQVSMLINRLNDHIFKGIKLEATQLKAIEILLRKVAPDLAQIEANVNVREMPEARVYPIAPDEHNQLPTASETVDSVH